MSLLFILNDALYGSEKLYNALRLAMKLQQEHADAEILIFLMADAVTGGLSLNQLRRAITTSDA